MARLTQRDLEQTVQTFYGIDTKTFEVVSIGLSKGGTLKRFGGDVHHVSPGRDAQKELHVAWNLTDVISVFPGMSGDEYLKERVSELKAKAAEQKAAAANRPA